MKKIILILSVIVSMQSMNALDFNKDDFCVNFGMFESIVVYKNTIYHIFDDDENTKVLSKIDRPQNLINENGYVNIELPTVRTVLLDYNGRVVVSRVNGNRKELDTDIGFEEPKEIKASSELIENVKNVQVKYDSKYPFYFLKSQKEIGTFFYDDALPWVPDIKKDDNPYLEFKSINGTASLAILPGYIDINNQKLFKNNSRIKTIEVYDMDINKKIGTYNLNDFVGYTVVNFPQKIKYIKIILTEYYPGNKYNDPCLSSIVINPDNGPDKAGLWYIQDLIKRKVIKS